LLLLSPLLVCVVAGAEPVEEKFGSAVES